jgi:hypothetical protein
MTDHEPTPEPIDETAIELTGCRDHLRDAQEGLTRLAHQQSDPEVVEALNKTTEALDALRRYGHDGRWGE